MNAGAAASPATRARWAAGGAVVALLALSLVLNLVWMGRNWDSLRPVTSGRPAPELALKDLDGQTVRLADIRGQTVLLAFWASWCGPCVREMPFLQELDHELGPRGFEVLAVNVEGSADKARDFLRRTRTELRVLVDDGGAAARYGVHALPHAVLVGPDGQILSVHAGAGGEEELRREIEAALPKKSATVP